MTKGQLKEKLNDYMMRNIVHLTKDPTLGNTLYSQMQGLIFKLITNDYWDECNNDEEI